MPELRQNLITRDWVIIATERAKRPRDFTRPADGGAARPAYREDCPFCPGNEHLCTPEIFRLDGPGGWKARIVPNKFPALSPDGERERRADGIFRSVTGVGVHEVIIETPRHDMHPALLPLDGLADLLGVYKRRYAEIRADKRMEAVIIFKNHGAAAGTSLEHPHSQVAATPVVPFQFRSRLEEAIRYFDDTGECVFCRTLREELSDGARIVFETEHFAAFIPYAALSPFHIWIFPRRHAASYDEITEEETADLALNLKTVLAKLYHGLNNPDYNYSVRSIPTHYHYTDFFHWYLTVIPRVNKAAGFEMGSGMFINPALPEKSAEFLRGAAAD